MVEATLSESSLAFTEEWAQANDPTAAARERAREIGCEPISAAAGATLRLLAAASGARAIVEVGTGAGVSGLWLFEGMRPDGVLTTIDVEAEHQRAAKEAFTEHGIASTRFRLINGPATEVLPRLTDSAYDIVFIDADTASNAVYHDQAVRLLRPGGIVAFYGALWQDRVANSSARDADTLAQRELAKTVRDDERLSSCLIAVGDGLLLGVKN